MSVIGLNQFNDTKLQQISHPAKFFHPHPPCLHFVGELLYAVGAQRYIRV